MDSPVNLSLSLSLSLHLYLYVDDIFLHVPIERIKRSNQSRHELSLSKLRTHHLRVLIIRFIFLCRSRKSESLSLSYIIQRCRLAPLPPKTVHIKKDKLEREDTKSCSTARGRVENDRREKE